MIFNSLKSELGGEEAIKLFPEYSLLPEENSNMDAKEQFELARKLMERLDCSLNKDQVKRIRHSHVCNLTKAQVQEINELKAKHDSIEELLVAYGCTKQNDGSYLVNWNNGKCVCGLCRGLNKIEPISKTWCECCNGHVIKSYSWICGLPINSEIIETYASGGKTCAFRISI